ncbi:MAG: tRNA (adenosine(37)-N6)-threonylcarbamoyltransferase complex ATPase subunit type 1 TsaE [Verrucomicrobia bacterium]|nr:tRNA (adenosine(37)-N6)-threonylcarbamoyltransferase complex ATPase subunit type 1 TsaE [Verrucomicrobiota bacterium]
MFISRSAAETEEFGEQLAARLSAGDVLALCGELGSGKTQLVKGIARSLGAQDVTSPTFTIVHEYSGGRLPLYHFDFYRLENSGALRGIDFDEYLSATGICVIEWADKFPGAIPSRATCVRLRICADGSRGIEVDPERQTSS